MRKDMDWTLELILETVAQEKYKQGSIASSILKIARKASNRVTGT